MSNIYKLSSSSEALLQSCIEKAGPPDRNNKWVRNFGLQRQNTEEINSIVVENNAQNHQGDGISTMDVEMETEAEDLNAKVDDDFFELLESDPISNFNNMVLECLKNEKLLIEISEKLSVNAMEKICTHIFANNDIEVDFLRSFYQCFLPVYLKRDYSWFSLDLLVKSHNKNPKEFDNLIILLIKSINIPNKLLEDFYQTLNEEEKKIMLFKIIEIDFSSEEFLHNLLLIYTAYKEVNTDLKIQDFIYKNIIQYGPNCTTEKTFGRLLLAFLQFQNKIGLVKDYEKVERIIENHCTPFKKPCINCLRENLDKYSN